jgi:hypothetical protein
LRAAKDEQHRGILKRSVDRSQPFLTSGDTFGIRGYEYIDHAQEVRLNRLFKAAGGFSLLRNVANEDSLGHLRVVVYTVT